MKRKFFILFEIEPVDVKSDKPCIKWFKHAQVLYVCLYWFGFSIGFKYSVKELLRMEEKHNGRLSNR